MSIFKNRLKIKFVALLISLLFLNDIYAQAPEAFNYQGAVNNTVTNPNNKMLKVYPNPSKSRVWVDIGERPLKGAFIKVLDSRGSEVRKIFITQQTTVIEWSGFVSGVYMLEVVNGNNRKTMRVVKE